MRLNKNRSAKRVAVVAGFLFLCAAPGLTRAQTSPPRGAPTPHTASPVVRPKKENQPLDDFAGLTYTDEQKAKIDQIRQHTKSLVDNLVKDEKLSPEQKEAM